MIDLRVYLVTDDPSRYRGDWLENVLAAVEGGVTCVQYRDTESDPATRLMRVRRLQDALRARHTPLIINNEAELARAVRAEGVHVGQGDLPPAAVRAIVGPTCEIGLSITDRTQLAAVDPTCVSCLGIGPVFDATATKADAARALGPEALAAIIRAAPALPTVAIGGITLATAPRVLAAGADGLAVVSAFSKADDPFATARAFRRLFEGKEMP